MRFAIIVRCSGRYSDAAIMRRERRRKSTESVEIVSFSNLQACTRGRVCVCVCAEAVWRSQREREREREREDRGGESPHSRKQDKMRFCMRRQVNGANVLKMNFSVEVNMYSENVTSYWYLLRWNQRRRADG